MGPTDSAAYFKCFSLDQFSYCLNFRGKKDHIDHYSKLSVKKALTSSEMWSVKAQILNQRGKIKQIFCPLWIVMILIIMIKMTMMIMAVRTHIY